MTNLETREYIVARISEGYVCENGRKVGGRVECVVGDGMMFSSLNSSKFAGKFIFAASTWEQKKKTTKTMTHRCMVVEKNPQGNHKLYMRYADTVQA
jgi:hypothetical protein